MSRADFTSRHDVLVDNILLDEGNPRIRAGSDQADCIARVLRKRDQMLKLMKSIAEEGLSTVPILVTSDKKNAGKWIVKDGNRRITALKCLNAPALCLDTNLRAQVDAIVKANKKNIPSKIDCLSSENPDAIAREVVLRHSGELGGIGQIDWSAYLRTIYLLNNDLSAEYKRAGQYLLWAEAHGVVVEDEFPITTVTRFFSTENIKTLGFNVVEDELVQVANEPVAVAMATRVIDDFATKKMKVDDVFTVEAAQAYLSQVRFDAGWPLPAPPTAPTPTTPSPSTSPPAGGAAPTATPAGPASPGPAPAPPAAAPATPSPKRGRTPSKQSWDRATLFWKGAPIPPAIPLSEVKMKGVIFEIGRIRDVRESPLTTAFLIRALIEVSEKRYRTKNSLIDKQKLADNIAAACDSMRQRSLITDSELAVIKAYTVTRRSDVGVFNVDTLQKYLHRETHFPVPQTINTMWDELCPFVRACWA